MKISSSTQIMHKVFNGKSYIFSMFASDFFTYFYCLFNAVMPKGKRSMGRRQFSLYTYKGKGVPTFDFSSRKREGYLRTFSSQNHMF